MMKLPFTNSIEKVINNYGVIFTLIVMYQGLFGAITVNNEPKILSKLDDNVIFKLITLFAVGFTATKDVETALTGVLLFVLILHLLRTKEEKNKVTLTNFI